MTLWLILGAMTALTVAMLLRPLFRGMKAGAARDAYDREVYRDQLAEVKRDEARGLLAPQEARAAEREIARRLIAAAPSKDGNAPTSPAAGPQPAKGRAARRWTALALATALPLAAIALYLYVGTPTAPDFPLASRDKVMQSEGMHDINEVIPKLEARLKAKPDDLEGWVLLGRSYASLDRMAEAAEAYRHAVALSNNDPDLVAAYAETKVLEGGGAVTPEARKLFEGVLAKDAKNVPARFYLALVKVQEGDVEAGVREWLVIQAEAPPDAPWLPELHGAIERAAQEYKLDLAKLVPPGAKVVPPMAATSGAGAGSTASAGTPSGPSAADVAAAENMSDAQRQDMIRSMVERLAERLKGQPDDLAGWQRLARAYDVLGEKEKATEAEAHVAKLEGAAKGAPAQSAPPAAAAAGAAPAPSAADVAAAQNMSAEQHQEKIRAMAERLAEQLKGQPDDLAGWRRLASAYEILGERDKATAALAQAAALAPKDPDVLVAYGNALLAEETSGDAPPAKAAEVMRQVLALDAGRKEALWVVGLADAAQGDKQAAAALWGRLLAQLSPGTPEYLQVKSRLDGLGAAR